MSTTSTGQDTGSKYVGTACIANDKILYQSEVILRDDIKKKMDSRRGARKNRRYRKTRYRKMRFLNRANSTKKDRLPPSVKSKVQSHDAIETFGFVTKENRNNLNLQKEHYIDACVIASGGNKFKQPDWLFKKRRIPRQNRQLCKGVRGEKKIPTGKLLGFRRYDKVRYLSEICFVKGRRSNGGFVLMNINNSTIDFRDRGGKQNPSYKLLERLNTRRSILCISQRI